MKRFLAFSLVVMMLLTFIGSASANSNVSTYEKKLAGKTWYQYTYGYVSKNPYPALYWLSNFTYNTNRLPQYFTLSS